MRTMRDSTFGALHGIGLIIAGFLLWLGIGFAHLLWDKLSTNQQWVVIGTPTVIGLTVLAWRAYKEQS